MKYLLVKNINELIDKPLHSPCIIYETDNEKVRYEDYGNTMFYFNEQDGKLVATPYKITLKKDTFEDSDIIDILDILEVEGPTTNLRFKINDSRFLLKNNTIIPRVAHVETDLELTVYTKYTEDTFILHIVCEDDLQIIREFKNVTYPDTIEGYQNKITITYTEIVTITNALGTKKVEAEEIYDYYFAPEVNTDHTTEDFGTNEDTVESKTREVYLKFNEEDYYLGTVTQKNKKHEETWCYHTDNTVKVFNLEQSLYDGVSWNNMDMANTYRLIVGSTVTQFFGLMVAGSPVNTIIFEDTINVSSALANTTAGLENLKKVVCKGLAYGNSSNQPQPINVEEIYLLGNDTTLKDGFFASCNAVKKLVLPETLTAIPDGLCNNASNLSNITLYDNITSIGTLSFGGCTLLENIKIPNSVMSIGEGAFVKCCRLESIDIPNSVTSIGESAFSDCSGLTSIDIPNSVTSIGRYAFSGCSRLKGIIIPNSVTILRDYSFAGCSSLTSITIPNSVTAINANTFRSCLNLKNVSIGNSVLEINSTVFEGCTNITNLRIEDGNNPINLSSTIGNWPLETLYLGRDLGSKTHSAMFSNKSTLYTATIGNSVTSIGYSTFQNCPNLTSVVIGNSVKVVRSSAFSNCGIQELEFPDSVETIEYSVAANCPNLKRVKMSANLESMCTGFCVNCSNLDTVNDEHLKATLPDSLVTLNEEGISAIPFVGTKIKTLVIPKNITSYLSSYTSGNNPNIETCILHCKDAIEKGNVDIWAFFMLHVKKVFIPEDCKYCKINLNNGSDYYKDISLNTDEPNVLKLPDAYTGEFGLGSLPTNLKEVILSDNVTSLGKYAAFGLSDSIETVDLKNVHTINAHILNYRTKLDYINLPKTVKSVDTDLFEVYHTSTGSWGFLEIDWDIIDFQYPSTGNYYSQVSHLLKLNIGQNTKLLSSRFNHRSKNTLYYPCILDISNDGSYIDIANKVFFDLSIKSLHIPERVQSIAPESFNSKYLESITVDSNNSYYTDYDGSNVLIDKIDNSLLLGCAASTIPEGVVKIHTNAFYECQKLHELEIPETVTILDRYAINTCKNLGLLKIKNRSTLNIGDYAVDITTPTQVILDVTSVPTISSVSFRLGNDHKIYIPKNLESAFKANTNWAKLNLVPCESFDTFTVKVNVNVEVLSVPIIANIGEVLPLSIKVDGESTSLVGDLKYYNTLGEHTLELTYLSALHLGTASESIVRDYTSDAGANTIVNIEYLDEYITGLIAYYTVEDISEPTQLLYNGPAIKEVLGISKIYVDGVDLGDIQNNYASYQFTEAGEHIVRYEFEDPTVVGKNTPLFHQVPNLKKIVVGNSFNKVNPPVLQYCPDLEYIEILEGVKEIASGAFYENPKLKSVKIPKSVTAIGNIVPVSNSPVKFYFEDPTFFTNISIVNSNQSLFDQAHCYVGDTLIEQIVVQEGTKVLNAFALNGATPDTINQIVSIDLPSTLEKVETPNFWNLPNIQKIRFRSSECPEGLNIGNLLTHYLQLNKAISIEIPRGTLENYLDPGLLGTPIEDCIQECDFYDDYGVVTVYYDIQNITSATRLFSSHYNNVCAITVDGEPVSPTRALYWFTTPGIHTVKYYFYNKYHCFEYGNNPMFVGIEGISKIEIGESFNFIYRYLLSDATIGSLQVDSSNPPVMIEGGGLSSGYPIYVPAESVEMYKTSSGWSTYADSIQAIS